MAINWCPGTISRKQVWADGLFTLHVDVEGIQPFEPGQFLQIGFDDPEGHLHRPYSVGSPFGSTLEFYIVVVEDGQLTPRLWKLEEGDALDIAQRAAGSFVLSKTPDAENLWLIATGTGLAPYVAMLRTDDPWKRFRRIIVVHGVRLFADLGYSEYLNQLSRKHPDQLFYVPALTRDSESSCLSGRIPQCLEDGSLENAGNCELKPDNSAIMLCGNPAMLDEMEEKLGDRGLTRHRRKSPGQIVLERYW